MAFLAGSSDGIGFNVPMLLDCTNYNKYKDNPFYWGGDVVGVVLAAVTLATLAGERLGAAYFAREAEAEAPELSISSKIANQMEPRGWSEKLIDDAVANPAATHSVWDFTTGAKQAATAYERADGSYVVVNDSTGAVVQVSDINDAGWKPVWNDPRFQR